MADINDYLEKHDASPFESWRSYLETANYSDGTRELYLRHLQEFVNWLPGIDSPDELLDLQLQAVEKKDPRALAVIPRKISEYEGYQVKVLGRHPNTAATTKKAIKNFFTTNHVPINFLRTKRVKPKGVAYISRDELLKAYTDYAPATRPPERTKALLLTLKDTGLRVEEAAGLSLEQFLEADVYTNDAGEEFRVYRDSYFIEKTGTWGWPHFGSESVAAIKEYVGHRRSGALFLDRAGPIKGINITTIMRRLLGKLDAGRKLSAHSCRKFHETELERAGMPLNWIMKLQGKEIGNSTAAYSRPEEGQVDPTTRKSGGMMYLTEKYIEYYDALRVLAPPLDSKAIKEQEQRILELEAFKQKAEGIIEHQNPVRAEWLAEKLQKRLYREAAEAAAAGDMDTYRERITAADSINPKDYADLANTREDEWIPISDEDGRLTPEGREFLRKHPGRKAEK